MARQSPKPKARARDAQRRNNNMLWIGGAAAAVLVVVVLAVLASNNSPSDGAGKGPVATSAPSKNGQVGGRVGELSLTSIDDETVRLPAARPGALFFTVSQCTSCIPSAKALAALKQRSGFEADALYISMDPYDTVEAMRARRDSIGDPPYPFAIDTSGQLANNYQVTALGTIVIYDDKGKIVSRMIDPTQSDLESAFRKAGVS